MDSFSDENKKPESETPEKTVKTRSAVDAMWDLLASTRFAVVLLAFIALTALAGAFVPQNPQEAQMAAITREWGAGWVKALSAVGAFDLYHTKWFQASLALLCISLFICSLDRLPGTIRLMRRRDPVPASGDPERMKLNHKFFIAGEKSAAVEKLEKLLRGKRLSAVRETRGENDFFLINRGAWSRLGVYVVHASLIVIVIGAIIGNIVGYEGRLPIVEGETAKEFFLMGSHEDWVELGFSVKCEQFTFSIDPDTGMAGDYESKLVIIDNGKEVDRLKLRVNHPYHYKGVGLYQSSYKLESIESATIKVIGPDGGEMGKATVPGNGDSVEIPGGGSIRIVRAQANERTNTIGEVTFELDTKDMGQVTMDLRPGEIGEPAAGVYNVVISVRKAGDANEISRVELTEGEERDIGDGVTIKLLDYIPTFPVHGREEAAARIMVTTADESRAHILFEAFPDFDKMNIQGDQYYTMLGAERESMEKDYDGPKYQLVSMDGLYTTILDVNHDPGVPVVYFGCTLLIIGLYVAFFISHRKIWMKIEPRRFSMGGLTNRNAIVFEKDFRKMAREIENAIAGKSEGGDGE